MFNGPFILDEFYWIRKVELEIGCLGQRYGWKWRCYWKGLHQTWERRMWIILRNGQWLAKQSAHSGTCSFRGVVHNFIHVSQATTRLYSTRDRLNTERNNPLNNAPEHVSLKPGCGCGCGTASKQMTGVLRLPSEVPTFVPIFSLPSFRFLYRAVSASSPLAQV